MKQLNKTGGKTLRLLSIFILSLFTAILTPHQVNAQSECYNFTQELGTYTPLSGGSVFQSGTAYSATYDRPIGFGFDFMDLTNQTEVTIYRYGYIKFGAIYSSLTAFQNTGATSINMIAAMQYYNYPSASPNAALIDITMGVAPNRVYICEVRDWSRLSNDADQRFNYQYHLYEGSNRVEIRYGYFACPENYTNYFNVGIKGSTGTDYQSRDNGAGDWLNSDPSTSINESMDLGPSKLPPHGLIYSWERPSSLKATFIAKEEAYVNTVVKYTSLNTGFNIEWDKDNDGSIEATSEVYNTTYPTAGTYSVKMKASKCLLVDSLIKDITILDPTTVPSSDFVAYDNDVLIFDNVQFYDISTQGPLYWEWIIFDKNDSFNSHQVFEGSDPLADKNLEYGTLGAGKLSVCLKTQNSLGFSARTCKYDYITVNDINVYFMGPIKNTDVTSGTITDNNGIEFNYSDDRNDEFLIAPCNADSIILTISQFRMADAGERLLIYDGPNAGSKPFHPTDEGFTINNLPPKELIATSGAMYLRFITNENGQDSGFIASWKTILGNPDPPVASFTHPDTIYTGVPVTIKNTTGARGEVFHEWNIQGDPTTVLSEDLEGYTFITSGLRNVCLQDSTCVGDDTYCKDLFVFTPVTPIKLDFTADKRRVKAGADIVTLSAITEQANMYEWSIFPNTFTPQGPADEKEFEVKFDQPGPYTITLKAWNSIGGQANTQKIVLKDDYVIAVEYCTPLPQITSSDIGISRVLLQTNPSMGAPVNIIDNESETGITGYTDYSVTTPVPAADLSFGVSYEISLYRPTPAVNAVNRKAWIDFNIDGEFDATEAVLNSPAGNAVKASNTFTTPDLKDAFEGESRMRVSAVYNNQVNGSCGSGNGATPLIGEYEDYPINLVVDPDKPVISLTGSDTVFVEVNNNYTELGATVFDASQGDISGNLVITGEVDTDQTGIYRLTYNAKDASGNQADNVTRVIIVVVDNTAPVLDLIGDDTITMEVFSDYTEEGADALDGKDGDLESAIKIENNVDNTTLGTYTVVYTVADNQGNTAVKTRIVHVVDTQKPEILALGSDNIQVGTPFVDMTTVSDNYDQNPDITITGEVVNSDVIGEYKVTYTAVDGSGNVADVLERTYKVDDFIAPDFSLSSSDLIIHDVHDPLEDITQIVDLSENYYPLSQVKVTIDESQVDINTLGTYTISFTATDPSGNTKTRTRDIKVVDRKAPILFGSLELSVKLYDENFWVYEGLKTLDNYYSPSELKDRIEVVSHDINVFKPGTYHATFMVSDPSGNISEPFTRIIRVCADCETTTDIEDVKAPELSVYPNPSTGVFTVSFELFNTTEAEVEIYNNVGALVSKQEVTTATGTLSVDLSAQPNGVYFIKLVTADGVVTKKMIVSK